MKTALTLEFVPAPDPEAGERHSEMIDLFADGLARLLLAQARAEAEARLGRPLRSPSLADDEGALPSTAPTRRLVRVG